MIVSCKNNELHSPETIQTKLNLLVELQKNLNSKILIFTFIFKEIRNSSEDRRNNLYYLYH